MTVQQLITLLQTLPQDLPVMAVVDGAHCEVTDAEWNGDVDEHSRILLTIDE